MTRRKLDEENVRKLTKVGETSLAVTIPKSIVQKLKLRERQKVRVMLSGKNIIIKDWKN
ncbi:AbrB/MazE/SpoVT family DNA-binding domain-containing protein [Patescibacteria group bacterium]|nr:AbrB/MazE/SpoVT family DNA-binding domain-containing protein [Patescibacteria group bacterium]